MTEKTEQLILETLEDLTNVFSTGHSSTANRIIREALRAMDAEKEPPKPTIESVYDGKTREQLEEVAPKDVVLGEFRQCRAGDLILCAYAGTDTMVVIPSDDFLIDQWRIICRPRKKLQQRIICDDSIEKAGDITNEYAPLVKAARSILKSGYLTVTGNYVVDKAQYELLERELKEVAGE